jgi:hypothetical protein
MHVSICILEIGHIFVGITLCERLPLRIWLIDRPTASTNFVFSALKVDGSTITSQGMVAFDVRALYGGRTLILRE